MDRRTAYLESLIRDSHYRTWERGYAPVSVKGKSSVSLPYPDMPPEFALQVDFWADGKTTQSLIDPGSHPLKTRAAGSGFLPPMANQRIPALEALSKSASEHVLLVGRPGSGKTTILRKMLLEQAKAARATPSERIPVLVELKFVTDSIQERIRKFLGEHGWEKSAAEIEGHLDKGEFLLLLDGLNELPPETRSRGLEEFRRNHRKTTPMIFTARDVGLGFTIGVEKKFELLPMDKAAIEKFVRAYLGSDAALSLLAELECGRLREVAEIPMFLQMLCARYAVHRKLPLNPALLFRDYLKDFYPHEMKYDIDGQTVSKSDWYDMVAYLAFRMLEGPSAKNWRRTIPISRAEEILQELFKEWGSAHSPEYARQCVKELLDHYIVQLSPGSALGFSHDLIQEFFAAEYLSKVWSRLDQNTRKRKYLNNIKWAEPLCLMMGLVDSEEEAVQLVRSGFEVDEILAAKLVSSAQPQFQRLAVEALVLDKFHDICRLQILGDTRSREALPAIELIWDRADSAVRPRALRAGVSSDPGLALPLLKKALEDQDSEIRAAAVKELSIIRSDEALALLSETLKRDESESVRFVAILSLASFGKSALPHLDAALQQKEWWCRFAAIPGLGALGMMGIRETVLLLEKAFYDEYDLVRVAAAGMLAQIRGGAALPLIEEALRSEDPDLRATAAAGLGLMGSEAALEIIHKVLEDEDFGVRWMTAAGMAYLPSQDALAIVNKILQPEKPWPVRWIASKCLRKIVTESALPLIERALQDKHPRVREEGARALKGIDTEAALPLIEKALKDGEMKVRKAGADSLLGGNERAVAFLLKEEPDLLADLHNVPQVLFDVKAVGAAEYVKEWFAKLSLIARLIILGTTPFEKAPGFDILKVPVDHALIDALSAGEIFGELDSEIYQGLVRLSDPKILTVLRARWRSTGDENCFACMKSIPAKFGFYNLDYVHDIRRISPQKSLILLHLSDLHFCEKGQGLRWFTHLVQDLESDDLRCQETGINGLLISGDISFQCKEEGYAEVRGFINAIKEEYSIEPAHIILVPGNHDVSHGISRGAYQPKRREDAQEDLKLHRCKDRGDLVEVPIEERLRQRFEHFQKLVQDVTGRMYPEEYDKQWELATFDETKLLILGLNSAWEIDHHFAEAANIHQDALAAALREILGKYKEFKKIGLWHHPLISSEESRIKDHDFLGLMVKDGFRLVLHGHIHKFGNEYVFRQPVSLGSGYLEAVAAGTIGAPPQELRPAYPWEYNLMVIKGSSVRINTRMRSSRTGPWGRFAHWPDPSGHGNLWYYEFDF
ncbi:MAG: HEAT repeat domain-containing protein [Desulfomonilaceae bacterium]